MYSGWVGDQDPNFGGLQDAMRNIIHSAWHGFANFGSDIGGFVVACVGECLVSAYDGAPCVRCGAAIAPAQGIWAVPRSCSCGGSKWARSCR